MRKPTKPPALFPGCKVIVVSPASPADPARLERGCHELIRLGYEPRLETSGRDPVGYFSGSTDNRRTDLVKALQVEDGGAAFCARGGGRSAFFFCGFLLPAAGPPPHPTRFSDTHFLLLLAFWRAAVG